MDLLRRIFDAAIGIGQIADRFEAIGDFCDRSGQAVHKRIAANLKPARNDYPWIAESLELLRFCPTSLPSMAIGMAAE